MPTLMEMLEAGVHFGHKKERSHPKMKDYTFTLREGIFIIDLDKTRDSLESALEFLKQEYSAGKTILFVGTKRQAKIALQETAELAGMPYVVKRWLGGTLTNFATVKKSITEMESLEARTKSPEFEALTKKEKKIVTDKLEKLQGIFTGIKDLKNLPDVVFVIDANREKLAVDEASKMGIPVVAVADTDADPTKINYLIPANEDAVKSVELIMDEIATAFGAKPKPVKEEEAEISAEDEKVQEIAEIKEAGKDKKPAKKNSKKSPSTKLGAGEKK